MDRLVNYAAFAEWLDYPSGWPETRYAAKARRQGRVPHQFRYRRLG